MKGHARLRCRELRPYHGGHVEREVQIGCAEARIQGWLTLSVGGRWRMRVCHAYSWKLVSVVLFAANEVHPPQPACVGVTVRPSYFEVGGAWQPSHLSCALTAQG